jgi:hypothetical protein
MKTREYPGKTGHERKKPGPIARQPQEKESPWMIKPFPDALRARLKDAAHDHRMSLRAFVIMALTERVQTTPARPPIDNAPNHS